MLISFLKSFRWFFVFGILSLVIGLFLLIIPSFNAHGQNSATSNQVLELNIDSTISNASARFLAKELDQANLNNYALVVIRLNTPGGNLEATRDMVNSIINSTIPIAVYVGPDGARAASAGTFIGAAADFLAMATVSNIGAASPVDASGENLPTTLNSKVREDAAALIRSIAELRKRNVTALEQTIFNARSYTASEAVQLGIADFIVNDINELLNLLNGMQFENAGITQTLNLENFEIISHNTGFLDAILSFLSNPSIAYFFIVIGVAGILIEITHFGLIIPGFVGIVFLSLGAVGAWQLPLSWIGVTLILLAAILFIAELFISGTGILAILGGVALVLGGIFLFDDSQFLGVAVAVSPWVIGITATLVTVILFWFIYEVRRARNKGSGYLQRTRTGNAEGKTGIVTSTLDPDGEVFLNGEYWSASSSSGVTIPIDKKVNIKKIKGLHLLVEVKDEDEPTTELLTN